MENKQYLDWYFSIKTELMPWYDDELNLRFYQRHAKGYDHNHDRIGFKLVRNGTAFMWFHGEKSYQRAVMAQRRINSIKLDKE